VAGVVKPPAAVQRRRWWLWGAVLLVGLVAAGTAVLLHRAERQREKEKKADTFTLTTRNILYGPCDSSKTNVCGDLTYLGNDAGSGTGDLNINYYRANPFIATGRLGDYVQCTSGCSRGYAPFVASETTSIVVNTTGDPRTDPLLPVHPLGFSDGHCVQCADRPFSVWSMSCPAGWVALGDVIHPSCTMPSTIDYYCVPQGCVEPATTGPAIWDNNGGCYEGARMVLYGVRAPDQSTVNGNFFKAAYGPSAASMPPTTGIYALRTECTGSRVIPPLAADRVPDGSYRIRWRQTQYYLGQYTFFGSSGVVLVEQPGAIVWTVTTPSDGSGGTRVAPSSPKGATDEHGARVDSNGHGPMSTTSSTAPPAPIFLGQAMDTPLSVINAWVLARNPNAAPDSANAGGVIYNAHLKGYVQAVLIGNGSGAVMVVGYQNDTTVGWYFEPALPPHS